MKNDLKHSAIEPARFKLDGGGMYGIIPKPLWNKVHPADEHNRVDLALRLWVLQKEDKVVVVDTGIGDYHDEKFNNLFDVRSDTSPLEQALNNLGLNCNEVTDLIISHLHFDHVGGLGVKNNKDEWQLAFPNANCHLHQKHWDYSKEATQRDKGSFHSKNFEPLLELYKKAGKLITYNDEGGTLKGLESLELQYIVSFGHTPWLLHPFNKEMIYMADLVPTSNHIHIPWVMGYDISPGTTTKDKEKFLPFIHEKNLTMIFEHDPVYWGAKLTKDDRGRLVAGERFEAEENLAYTLKV